MRRFLFMLPALAAVAACSTLPPPSPGGLAPVAATSPTRADTIEAVASTSAAVADAVGQAPPATLSRTTIDDKAIRLAYQTFDHALDVVDAFVAGGDLPRNSASALAVRRGILATQDALNAASAAQRAGSAATYTSALQNAERALADVQSALAR